MNGQDYKTIDTSKPDERIRKLEKLKKGLKIAVGVIIFLPLVFFILINFILKMHIPEKMYAILGIVYLAIFTITIIMSLLIPHS